MNHTGDALVNEMIPKTGPCCSYCVEVRLHGAPRGIARVLQASSCTLVLVSAPAARDTHPTDSTAKQMGKCCPRSSGMGVHRTTNSSCVFLLSLMFRGPLRRMSFILCRAMKTDRHFKSTDQKQIAASTWMPKISPCRRRFCSHSELHLFVDFCAEGCAVVRCRIDQPGQEHPLLAGLNRWVNWRGEKMQQWINYFRLWCQLSFHVELHAQKDGSTLMKLFGFSNTRSIVF